MISYQWTASLQASLQQFLFLFFLLCFFKQKKFDSVDYSFSLKIVKTKGLLTQARRAIHDRIQHISALGADELPQLAVYTNQ